MSTRGIFLLENVRSRQREGDWVPLPSVWAAASIADNGYIGPGYVWPSNPLTTVSKITYSTDSIAIIPSGNFPESKRNAATFSSLTAGYITAGIGAPASGHPSGKRNSYTYKFVYATETTARALPGPATNHDGGSGGLGNNGMGGVSNTEIAYTNNSDEHGTPSANYSKLFKFTFASETWNTPGSFNESWYDSGQGFGNQTYAYWAGGTPGVRSNVRRVAYSTDTMAYPTSNLPAVRSRVSASSDADAAYLFYGRNAHPAPSATPVSTIIKLTYSTETSSMLPSYMNDNAGSNTSATGNLSNGYVTGKGYTTPAVDGNSSVSKFNYSTGTASNVGSNPQGGMTSIPVWSARMYAHPGKYAAERFVDGANSGSDVGYVTMGQGSPGGSLRSSTEKLDMVTDTSLTAVPGGNVPFPGMQGGCSFGNNTDGITATGGNQPDMSTDYTYVNKFTYSTETFSSLSGYPGSQTAEGRGYAAGATGYYVGGFVNMSGPADLSSVNKFAFASDTWSESPSPLNDARYWFANIQNETEGWALGGYHPSKTNSEKITFSTDTWSSESSTLPSDAKTYYIGANGSGDATAGYWAGGHPSPGSHKVWKLEYATGTVSNALDLSPSSPADRWTLNSGMANETKGYFAGGLWSLGQSEVVKFPYATETGSNINPGMTQTRQGAFSFGPRKLGSRIDPPTPTPTPNTSAVTTDFGLRSSGGTVIDKLDFTTDTVSLGLETPSDVPETGGHDGEGWYDQTGGRMVFGTGGSSGPINEIKMGTLTGSRIPSLSPVAVLPGVAMASDKVWNYSATEGWYQGGVGPSTNHHTTATRLTFATDTLQDQTYGRLQNGVSRAVGLSNPTHKYAVGGRTSPSSANDRSYVQKGSFASGDFSQTPSANLNAKTSDHGGTGNATEGYIAGRDASPSNGASPESRFQKLTYSNDTMSTLPGSTLGISVDDSGRYLSGTGNQTTGYFGGGSYMGPLNGWDFPIVKLVYATGTPSSIPHWITSSNTGGSLQQSSGEQNGNGTSPIPNIMK